MQKMKPQLKVVIILNFVIVALVVGLFFVYKTPEHTEEPPVSGLPDIYTSWQAEVCEQNEKPVASFVASDLNSIHIFGNCSPSSDTNKIFFATVSDGELKNKKILDIETAVSASPNKIYDCELKKVCIAEVGYMLAIQGYIKSASGGKIDVTFVAAVDYDGKIVKTDIHPVISPERVADAFYADGKLFLVVMTGYSEMNINNIKIYRYSTDVSLETSLSADHLGNMEYLFITSFKQGYLLCFNVKSLNYNCAAFAYLVPGTNATFSYAQMQTGYRALDFTVYNNGYALICVDENDNGFLLKLSRDFEITNTSYFAGSGNKYEGKILYTEKGYYIHSCSNKELYKYDKNLNESKQLSDCDFICDSASSGNITVVSAICDDDPKLYISDNEERFITLKSEGKQTFATILKTASGLVLVTDTVKDSGRGFIVIKLNGEALSKNI